MRVLSPERICAIQAVPYNVYGLPLGGEWIDVPDYFDQVTRRRKENDVIHAKMVDGAGNSYLTTDLLVDYPGEHSPRGFQQYWFYGEHTYLSLNLYKLVKQTVPLPPSPKYKGKHRKIKYVRRDVRVSDPIAVTFLVSSHSETKGIFTYYCWRLSGRIYALRKAGDNPATGERAELVYQEFYIDSELDFSAFPIVTANYSVRESSLGRSCFTHPSIHHILQQWMKMSVRPDDHDKAIEAARSIATHHLSHDTSDAAMWLRNFGYGYEAPVCPCRTIPFPDLDVKRAFILNEPAFMAQRADPALEGMMVGLSTMPIEKMTQHALLEACNSLPRLSDNSISNILEVAKFVKSLVVDHEIEIPKSLSSAWLSYRYQYSTTKLDVTDAIKFVNRHIDVGNLDRVLRSHSVYHDVIHGTEVTCRCSIAVSPKHVSKLAELMRSLDMYGLTPDFYVIWDMIPYSFMVDWFLPVSDILSVEDVNRMYFSGEFYEFRKIIYSLTYTRELGGRNVKCYTRWVGSVPSSLNGLYWLDAPSASNKTVGYRILDAASIFIGK